GADRGAEGEGDHRRRVLRSFGAESAGARDRRQGRDRPEPARRGLLQVHGHGDRSTGRGRQTMTSELWFWPLVMCLILAGIHGYLGIHVLKRKVIFVDLAMAQIAALGAAYGIFLGYEPRTGESGLSLYLFSLALTLVGAAVIALVRMKQERVPQEAF